MKKATIESLDRRRYWATLGQTVGIGLFFAGVFLVSPAQVQSSPLIVFFIAFGVGLFLTTTWKLNHIRRIISGDELFREALNNEMHQMLRYRSYVWAFGVCMATSLLLFLLAGYLVVDARLACGIIFYAGLVTNMIAWLIYNR